MQIAELVQLAHQSSEEAMLELIHRFQPLLKKYASLLQIEDAYEELQYAFIVLIKKTDWNKLFNSNDGAYVNYFNKSIYRQYLALQKKTSVYEKNFSSYSENGEVYINSLISVEDQYNTLIIQELKSILTYKEFQVIYWTCLKGFSAALVAKRYGQSRQNINQIRKRAIKKLQQYFHSEI